MNEKTTWSIEKLHNYEKNARAIKKEDFERLKKQIQAHGQMQPLVITGDGTVLGGNMRLRAYKELGINDVWISIVDPKSEADKLKISLVLNDRAGYYVEQDLAELIQEFGLEINLDDYKIDLGKALTLTELLNQFAPDVEEDEAPELAEGEPESKLGEVYQLGRHRLMCGDATKIEDVEKLMDGNKADMVFTDPPYGINAVSASGVLKETYKTDILNDGNTEVAQDAFNLCMTLGISKMIWWGANYYANILPPSPCWFVWDKNNGGSDQMDCELAWTSLKGVTRQFTQASEKTNRTHPTQKPISLCAWGIKPNTKENEIVLDLFGGSGSTLIACEQTNRVCYMMELDPKYCDVIRKRYENFVAKQAQITEK